MESGDVEIQINSTISFQNSPLPSRINSVFINLLHKFRRFSEDESDDGTLNFTGFHPAPPLPVPQIRLNLFSYEFSPNYLFSVIDSRLDHPDLSHHIANTIADKAIQHDGFQNPFYMSVNVVLIEDVLVSIHDSHQIEDKKVEEEDLKSQCAICLEDLQKCNDEETLKLAQCSHQFHFECIGEWLQRRNSCPLCREIVFEES